MTPELTVTQAVPIGPLVPGWFMIATAPEGRQIQEKVEETARLRCLGSMNALIKLFGADALELRQLLELREVEH